VSNCGVGWSTAKLCRQLASYREEIEAEISRVGPLSIRQARRLITKPKPDKQAPELPTPDSGNEASEPPTPGQQLLAAWESTSDDEKREALAQIDVKEFIRVMPRAWDSVLTQRVRANDKAQKAASKARSISKGRGAIPKPTRTLQLTATEIR
jgi:hypothetical protein